jgi:N-acetyltransferase
MIKEKILLDVLTNSGVELRPLQWEDLDELRLEASDPAIWEQHPAKERASEDGFKNFFEASMNKRSTYVIHHIGENKLIGMSSYYDYDDYHDLICIGFTFIGARYWGQGVNAVVKEMMMQYAYDKLGVKHILFHVDDRNIRSQKALQKIGAGKSTHQDTVFERGEERCNLLFVKSLDPKLVSK